MSEFIMALQDKGDKKAYELSKLVIAKSAESDEYYSYFEELLELLESKSSYVRTRAFMICCSQARWDENGKLKAALPHLLMLLHDAKPTVVRKCLSALHEVALFRPELNEEISKEVKRIDLSRYKDSMSPLIAKDMEALQKILE